MVDYANVLYKTFGFEKVTVYIATKPESAIGSDEVWDMDSSHHLHVYGIPFGCKLPGEWCYALHACRHDIGRGSHTSASQG